MVVSLLTRELEGKAGVALAAFQQRVGEAPFPCTPRKALRWAIGVS